MRMSPSMTVSRACLLPAGFAACATVLTTFTLASAACFATAEAATTTTGESSKTAVAVAARKTHLVESAQLHLTGEGESTLTERGRASGTFNAPVSAHLNLSVGHVTAVFTLYPKGGSVTGKAQARFTVRGSIAYYGGTLTVIRGTGIYRHASGSNIGISGTINHLNFDLTVKANGWITL
jgi:hypothetical protein